MHPLKLLCLPLLLSACGPGAPAATIRPDAVKAAAVVEEATCVDPSGEAEPLIIDLPARRRGDLEVMIREGIVLVGYDCQRLKILNDCEVEGDYAYKGNLVKEEVLRLENGDEIRANLPLSGASVAAKLKGEISRGATLDLAMAIVGQQRAARYEVSQGELTGRCEGATHFVRAVYVGAFAMKTGERAKAATTATLFDVGAGGASESARTSAQKDGDLKACRATKPEASAPERGCGALLRLYLMPLTARGVALKRAAPETIRAPTCPQGMSYLSGKCVKAKPTQICDRRSPASCQAPCQAGHGRACGALGYALRYGRGLAKDRAAAARAFSRGCALGDAASCTRLGRQHYKGKGVSVDKARGFELVKRGCDLGDGAGCFYAGRAYMSGDGVTKDEARGFAAYRQGCAAGDPSACTNLGKAYSMGQGVEASVTTSFKLYLRACEGGSAQGCFNVGVRHSKGKGAPQDDERALRYYTRACQLDHGAGCYSAAKRAKDPALMKRACQLKIEKACP